MSKFKTYKPRRGGPLPFRYVMIITFLFFMISTGFGLWIINKGLKPTLLAYAETQTSRIGTLVINKAINKKIADVLDIADITEEVKTRKVISFRLNIIPRPLTVCRRRLQIWYSKTFRKQKKAILRTSNSSPRLKSIKKSQKHRRASPIRSPRAGDE